MAEVSGAPRLPERPLSPHLQIYRFTWTMAMSILHRITGIALYLGTLLLAWWLIAAAAGPEAYATFQGLAGSWLGILVLIGFTWALMHHTLGGVRHMVQDAGYGFGDVPRRLWAMGTLIGSVALTILIWIAVFAAAR